MTVPSGSRVACRRPSASYAVSDVAVVAELVPGYRIGDKLIRAAMVAVAKAKPAAD